MITRLLYITISSLLLLLCSCSSHEPGGDTYGSPATFGLSLGVSEGTEATAQELISTWWVGFYKSDNTLVASRTGSLDQAVWEDRFDITLPAGDYTVVAVANQPAPEAFPSLATDVWTPVQTAAGWTGEHVPMTGHRTIHVNERGGQQFDVEVVRKVAKFEVQFTNKAQHPITVLGYTIHSLSGSTVWEYPLYRTLASAPSLVADATAADVVRTLGTTLQPLGEGVESDLFYCLESSAAALEPHGVYSMTVRLRHGADAPEVEAHALLTSLSYVNRNDHILLPVELSDYVITVECLFYPPIGGYPAKVVEDDQNNYTVTFGGPGDFALLPSIREAVPGALPLSLAGRDVSVIVTPVDGYASPFDVEPAFDSATGEILGVIGSPATEGRAYIELTVKVPAAAAGGVEFDVTRKFLVIRSV